MFALEWMYAVWIKMFPGAQKNDDGRFYSLIVLLLYLSAFFSAGLRIIGRWFLGKWPADTAIVLLGRPVPGMIGVTSLLLSLGVAYFWFDRRRESILRKFEGMIFPRGNFYVTSTIFGFVAGGVLIGYFGTYEPIAGLLLFITSLIGASLYMHASGNAKRWQGGDK